MADIPYQELPGEPRGEVPEIWKLSYLVPIVYYQMKTECTGVLISQLHVLVLARCFSTLKGGIIETSITGYTVYLSSHPWGGNSQLYNFKSIHVHPDFHMDLSLTKISNDIGVALVSILTKKFDNFSIKVVICSKFKIIQLLNWYWSDSCSKLYFCYSWIEMMK